MKYTLKDENVKKYIRIGITILEIVGFMVANCVYGSTHAMHPH